MRSQGAQRPWLNVAHQIAAMLGCGRSTLVAGLAPLVASTLGGSWLLLPALLSLGAALMDARSPLPWLAFAPFVVTYHGILRACSNQPHTTAPICGLTSLEEAPPLLGLLLSLLCVTTSVLHSRGSKLLGCKGASASGPASDLDGMLTRRPSREPSPLTPSAVADASVPSGALPKQPAPFSESQHQQPPSSGAQPVALLARLACSAICIYYVMFLLCSKLALKGWTISELSHEEWLVAMAACLMLGRACESSKGCSLADVAMHHVQSRLLASQALLSDVLPEHVVQELLDTMVGRAPEPAALAVPSSGEMADTAADISEEPLEDFIASLTALCPAQRMPSDDMLLSAPVTGAACAACPNLRNRLQGFSCPGVSSCGGDRHEFTPSSTLFPNSPCWAPASPHPLSASRPGSGSISACQNIPFCHDNQDTDCNFGSPINRHLPSCFSQSPSSTNLLAGISLPSMPSINLGRISSGVLRRLPTSESLEVSCLSKVDATVSLELKTLSIPSSVNVASSHACVSVFFSDIVGFSTWAHRLPPAKVMSTLNDLYSRLDDIILNEMPSLYKVETIGDAYVMAANLLSPDPDHAANIVRFALRAQEEAAKVPRPDLDDGSTLQMRIGIHSGPIMSGIVGKLRRRFSLFGDTMNMAARTESSCPPGRIQVTGCTWALAEHSLSGSVVLEERGEVQVKGSDAPLKMYLVSDVASE